MWILRDETRDFSLPGLGRCPKGKRSCTSGVVVGNDHIIRDPNSRTMKQGLTVPFAEAIRTALAQE